MLRRELYPIGEKWESSSNDQRSAKKEGVTKYRPSSFFNQLKIGDQSLTEELSSIVLPSIDDQQIATGLLV